MAFKHRKLIFNPNILNITAFCEPYCDPIENDNRICPPLICKKSCPFTCTNPFPSLIPPLNPPPSTTTASDHHRRPKNTLQNGHLYLIVSLSVLAVLCFVFSAYSIYKYYRNRNRAPPPQDETRDDRDQFLDDPVLDHPIWYIRTVGLQQSAIEAITICKYKRGDGLVEGTECSVCLNEFQEDETLRLLPKCNHAFHLPCIDTWLRSHTNCPMCRAGIVTEARPARPEPVQEANTESSVAVTEESQVVVVIEEEDIEERGFEDGASEEDVVGGEVQPMRRSVSLDCVSASMISNAIANANSDSQMVKLKVLNGSMGDSSMMKRSVSCSGNVLMKKSTARSQT